MNIALLFNPQHPTLGAGYGYAVMRLILGTGVLQTFSRHMRISRGDVVTTSAKMSEGVYTPRGLDLLIPERLEALTGPKKVWCWQIQNATAELAGRLHEALRPNPAYLGAMGVDFSDPLHLRHFRNSLPEAWRIMGKRSWLFYSMGESWAVDSATQTIYEENGFIVETEDQGARRTVFDKYDTLEHFRRVEDFKWVFATFDGLDGDKVSDLAFLLEEIHPKLFDVLASAARTIRRAETAEDMAQAALSGRRLLEQIADYLYAPRAGKRRGRDGKERDVGPANYKNRLWAYVEETLIESGLEDSSILGRLGKEADRLVELFNSGLHGDPTKSKVEAAFHDLLTWLTMAIQVSPTHARKAYLAYENELKDFMRKVMGKRL